MGSRTTEIAKHVLILAILFFAFLPLYLMVNISLKDNVQFARNPWVPEAPFHWENFAVGWRHVGPNILNTTFVAVTTTVLAMVLAVVGAFVPGRGQHGPDVQAHLVTGAL